MEFKLNVISIQEIGKRPNQEDCIYPKQGEMTGKEQFFILCDGMGGHEQGEVASQTVCEVMSNFLYGKTFSKELFYQALDTAYDALDYIYVNDSKRQPGTTITFLQFYDKGVFIAHIGDSRVYHIRPSEHKIIFRTKDHSLVNQLIELGEITPDEAIYSRVRNIITKAMLPKQKPRPKADIYLSADINENDYFMLCSDGMLEQMTDENIVNILSLKDKDIKGKAEILKRVTADNIDNHSAHLIQVLKVKKKNVFPWSKKTESNICS